MTRYNVGDTVRVKSKEWYNTNRGDDESVDVLYSFVPGMCAYLGSEVTIKRANESSEGDHCYNIKEDCGNYYWSNEMFEEFLTEP